MQTDTYKEVKEVSWQRAQMLGNDVKTAGREVCLAGLGALGFVAERGRERFVELVDRGRKISAKREMPAVPEPIQQAGKELDELRRKMEQRLEATVSQALKRVGVPDREEIQQLIARIEVLTRKVERMAAEQKA